MAGKAPYGTVAAILPYDAPPVMVARVGGAAILGGNQFRFSCSSQTPRTARLFAEVVAGLPGFTAVVGMDNREFGRACVDDPEVRVFFISGGGEVGAAYERASPPLRQALFRRAQRPAAGDPVQGRRPGQGGALRGGAGLRQRRPVLHHPEAGLYPPGDL